MHVVVGVFELPLEQLIIDDQRLARGLDEPAGGELILPDVRLQLAERPDHHLARPVAPHPHPVPEQVPVQQRPHHGGDHELLPVLLPSVGALDESGQIVAARAAFELPAVLVGQDERHVGSVRAIRLTAA